MSIQTICSRKLALILIANFLISLPLHAATGNRDGRLLVKWKDGPEITRRHLATIDSSFLDGLSEVSRNGSTFVGEIALQADGKVLVAGDFDTLYDNDTIRGDSRTDLARLNPDGTLDRSFKTVISGTGGGLSSLAVQSDGKVLIGGDFSVVNGVVAAGIARLWGNADIPPRLHGLIRSPTEVNLTWDALPHRTYRVQYKDSISAPWADLPGDVAGSSPGIGSKADSGAAKTLERFYRVVLLPDQM